MIRQSDLEARDSSKRRDFLVGGSFANPSEFDDAAERDELEGAAAAQLSSRCVHALVPTQVT
jgi:hypothetical protein